MEFKNYYYFSLKDCLFVVLVFVFLTEKLLFSKHNRHITTSYALNYKFRLFLKLHISNPKIEIPFKANKNEIALDRIFV